jgi:hypothetical protein
VASSNAVYLFICASNASPDWTVWFLGDVMMIRVTWKTEPIPIEWHQYHLLTWELVYYLYIYSLWLVMRMYERNNNEQRKKHKALLIRLQYLMNSFSGSILSRMRNDKGILKIIRMRRLYIPWTLPNDHIYSLEKAIKHWINFQNQKVKKSNQYLFGSELVSCLDGR